MDIPADLVVEILLRLPWTSRRRLRLVCRHWRDLIHEHTTEMQQRRHAVPLIVSTEAVYVVDDTEDEEEFSDTRIPRELHLGRYDEHMEVVGVCNGLLCLCDDAVSGGAITLANPATGDVLELPPVPRKGLFRRRNMLYSGRSSHQAYTFGYHHATGQYKVVHVPCFFESSETKDTLQVFTLGEAAWREVPAPSYAKCKLEAGLVSVNGGTYWVTEGPEGRIMCFDLESEQVTCIKPPPVLAGPTRQIAQVHRRLGVATMTSRSYGYTGYASIKVWVLENRRKEKAWINLYNLDSCPWPRIARPYFMHDHYVLRECRDGLLMYQHKPTIYNGKRSECTAVNNNTCYRDGVVVSGIKGDICRTFAYIKTDEALSVYRRW